MALAHTPPNVSNPITTLSKLPNPRATFKRLPERIITLLDDEYCSPPTAKQALTIRTTPPPKVTEHAFPLRFTFHVTRLPSRNPQLPNSLTLKLLNFPSPLLRRRPRQHHLLARPIVRHELAVKLRK